MPQTIDVSGLPEPVVRGIQSLVEALKRDPRNAAASLSQGSDPEGASLPQFPPGGVSREEWVARWLEFAATRKSSNPSFDDSRESIYEGRGE